METDTHVYLFATCVVDLFSPQSGLDAVEVLEALGVTVAFPRDQTCCGQPAYTTGFADDARRVAAAQLDLFPQPWPIVVPSGSCGGMLRHHWPRLFADDPQRLAQAEALAARTVEFCDFVDTRLAASQVADTTPVRLALHTSCTARRELATHLAGRRLLAKLPGVELLEPEHEAECCGFGGTFAIKHPEISAAMTEDKLDALQASGCAQFVSADCGCLLNLNGALERRPTTLRGLHIASFLRSRLATRGAEQRR
ncbi:(Fe-S)-binding protein [Solimonas terrae]|uniref:(Fe-S)-binding protein n=1 Tax=Solimonas terrae TaxID=1396819 RepID=A0A6M2BP62_9GAMM|nr:(Fe-S)-binding protein [Solimonas terrae]NGY04258.1 (Fe-S)-binding protein [Solimonas terrae]